MKTLLAILWPVFFFDSGEKFLNEIPAYQRDSYFREKVYAEHEWKSFYKLKEGNEIIDPDNYDLHLLNASVFFATNKLREEKHLKQLSFSSSLRDAALVHTDQMIGKKFFNHLNDKTLRLRTPNERMKLFGAKFSACAENIDLNNIPMPSKTTYLQLAARLVDAWYHSPPHRKTMLSRQYSHLGCAAMFETKNIHGLRNVKATQDYVLE